MASKGVTIDAAAEKLTESDMSDSDISIESVIDPTYEPNLQQSENSVDIAKTNEEGNNLVPTASSSRECVPVDNSQVTDRAKKGRTRINAFSGSENKKRRNSGLSYERSTTQKVDAKTMKGPCGCKRLKCHTIISEDRRKLVFNFYWGLEDITKQRQFIINSVIKHYKARYTLTSHTSRRKDSLKYYFCLDNNKVEACKQFFLNTLAISERTVQTAFKKSKNRMVEDDHRGKTKHNDEAMQQRKEDLRRHILSFPLVPSHYCRSSSYLLYLSSELTLSKMYSIYTEQCQHNQIKPLCYTTYWTVFQSMNISFHCPKKDRCETCERYRNLELQEQEEAESFQLHCQKAEKFAK